jgi:hypothetical protein
MIARRCRCEVLLPRQGAPRPVLESPQWRAEVAMAGAAGGKFS